MDKDRIVGAAKQAMGTGKEAVGNAVGGLTDIGNRATSVAGEIKATVDGLAGDARTRVEELASQATANADHVYGQIREAATAASTAVEKQPLLAMMTAGFIGCVVGFLLARR